MALADIDPRFNPKYPMYWQRLAAEAYASSVMYREKGDNEWAIKRQKQAKLYSLSARNIHHAWRQLASILKATESDL